MSQIIAALQHDVAQGLPLGVELRAASFPDIDEGLLTEAGLDWGIEGLTSVLLILDGAIAGVVGVETGLDPQDRAAMSFALAAAADQLQNDVIEASRQAWPKCPLHDHPLKAEERNDIAVWVCPLSAVSIAPIGGFVAGAE